LKEGTSEFENEKKPVTLKDCYAYPCQTTNIAGGKGAAQKEKCSKAESRDWWNCCGNRVRLARHKIISCCHFRKTGKNC